MKVFVMDLSTSRIIDEGEAEEANEKDYLKVNGQFRWRASCIKDTPENRAKFNFFCSRMKTWKDAEPNVYEFMNSLEK